MTTDECIWQSAWNIWQAQGNLNKLFDAFDQIKSDQQDFVVECEDSDECEGEFIQPVWNAYYSVRRSRRRNARVEGWITLAIQLACREGVESDWKFGKRAKVLVGYAPHRSFDYAWEFDTDSPNSAGYRVDCEVTATHWWLAERPGVVSWFYAIPLDQMTSTAAVNELIVTPVHAILRSADPQNPADVLQPLVERLCAPPAVPPDHI